MNNHTYLRAYLAGVFIPTLLFPVLITLLLVASSSLRSRFPSSAS
jgi:hypothetical protein